MTGAPPRLRRAAGFSLVEILVVITLIGLLMTFGFTAMQGAMESGRVTKCQDNLQAIGKALLIYKDTRNKGKWPREDGIRFLLTMHRHKQITGRATEVFLCPGTQDVNDTGPSGEPGSAYDDWDDIDSATISYAGRDTSAYPLRGGSQADQVLASDDNEFGPNHKTITNILYGDGSIGTFDLPIDGADLIEQYPHLEDEGLMIGPDCPYEPLQVLRID